MAWNSTPDIKLMNYILPGQSYWTYPYPQVYTLGTDLAKV